MTGVFSRAASSHVLIMLVMFDFISTVRDMTLHIRIQNFGSIRICFLLFNECGYTILHIQIKIK